MSNEAASVDDVLITSELTRRPSRAPDYNAENRVLSELAHELAHNPRGVLQKLSELVIELCHADSAGVSVIEQDGDHGIFRWQATAGGFAPNLHGTMRREASPCGTVMDRNRVLLFREPERFFSELRHVKPRIYESLLVPWEVGGRIVGTLWAIGHTPERRFDAEDARLLKHLARFASAAHAMATRAETEPDLRAERMAALNLMEDAIIARKQAEQANAALRASEERQAYLLRLSDALRPLSDPMEMQATAARVLGEYLGADRAYYVEIDEANQDFVVTRDWHRPAVPSHARRYPLSDWRMPCLSNGKTWVVRDVDSDPAMPGDQRESYRGNDIGATVVVPLIKESRLVATFALNQREPRSWTQHDVALVEETAERTWAAVERARAEAALRESEEKYRVELERQVRERTAELKQSRDLLRGTLDSSMDMIQVFEAIRDDRGEIVDFRWLLNNHTSESKFGTVRGESLLQRNPGVLKEGIFDTFKQVVETGEGQQHERHYAHEQIDGWFFQSVVKLGDGVATTTKEITEWKAAQEEVLRLRDEVAQAKLRESEERYRHLIDFIPAAVYAANPDGSLAYFNGRALELWGREPELNDKTWTLCGSWRTYLPDGTLVEPGEAPMARVLATGAPVVNQELKMERPDGSLIDILVNITALRDTAGNLTGAVNIFQDISERKLAEEALRTSEEQFRRAIEDAPIPVIMQAEDGQVLQISKTWTGLTGYTREEIPTFEAWLVHAYGPGAHIVREHMCKLFDGDLRLLDVEIEVKTRSGDMRCWAFSASAPGTLRDGRRFIVGMARDISERNQVEAALRESQERLRLIVENAREYAIFSMDLDRRITSWNAGAQAILGYTEEEILGRSADVIFTPEDCATGAPEEESHTALTRGRANDERWHVRKDGSRFWGSGVMTSMHDASGNAVGFVKIFRDETEVREAQQAVEQSREELWAALQETERARAEAEAAGKAKDHLLAVISHELRTPLTPVLMAVQTLVRRKDLPSEVYEGLQMIRENVQLEAHFIDDLLDLTRISRGKMEVLREPIDLHKAVRDAVEVCGADLQGKHQQLQVALEAEEHGVEGDVKRLQQVFWNLLKNASKFTPAGGEIWIRSRNDADRLIVEISDTGIGIDAESLEKIFTPFEQGGEWVTRLYGGLGLGLSISKATVEAHDGILRALSGGSGQGATFSVDLPLMAKAASGVKE